MTKTHKSLGILAAAALAAGLLGSVQPASAAGLTHAALLTATVVADHDSDLRSREIHRNIRQYQRRDFRQDRRQDFRDFRQDRRQDFRDIHRDDNRNHFFANQNRHDDHRDKDRDNRDHH